MIQVTNRERNCGWWCDFENPLLIYSVIGTIDGTVIQTPVYLFDCLYLSTFNQDNEYIKFMNKFGMSRVCIIYSSFRAVK